MARVSVIFHASVTAGSDEHRTQDILKDPEEIIGLKGNTIPRRLSVRGISFSAHVDYSQNAEFIDLIGAQHIVRPLSVVKIPPSYC